MRVLSIVHQPDAGPGVFGEAIRAAGATLEEWMIAADPEPPADPFGYDAVLVLGGAVHADQDDRHPWLAAERSLLRDLLAAETPLLGLCLGAQMLAAAAGATPRRAARPEIGWSRVDLTAEGREDPLLAPLAPGFEAFQWHSYECPLPPGAVALATSEVCLQAFRAGPAAWALQFHPEVSAADAAHWVEDYRSDPDAIAIGIDPAVLGPETAAKIGPFNTLGRDICGRWLDASAARRHDRGADQADRFGAPAARQSRQAEGPGTAHLHPDRRGRGDAGLPGDAGEDAQAAEMTRRSEPS